MLGHSGRLLELGKLICIFFRLLERTGWRLCGLGVFMGGGLGRGIGLYLHELS